MEKYIYKIATYNIRTDTHADGAEGSRFRWSHRFSFIKKQIEINDWDILGIQETRQNQLDDFKSLSGCEVVGSKRSESRDAEYNPIIFKSDKFDLIETETSWLSPSGSKNSQAVEWKAAYPRIFTTAVLKEIKTGQTLTFINTHFDHVSETARYHSAQLIAKKLPRLKDRGPVFLMGDFNGGCSERWYKVITNDFLDCETLAPHKVGPDVSCTMSTLDSDPSWSDMSKIDYIFYDRDVEVLKTETLTDKFHGSYPSDHFPLSVKCLL
ncbi:MAG: endonuclease/exonuclease/phosphatase family protein [Alkalibacterium sp.]|nr:endonuclease/exonuclease/phosphatase family protein [Alkalibacterium sp.]